MQWKLLFPFLPYFLSLLFFSAVTNFSSAFSILWLTDHNTWSIRSRHCTLYFSGSLALNKEPYLPQGTKPLCISCPRTSQIELVGEAYQAVHIFIRKCLFMNRPSLACEISVVWIFYMIVNMKLQYLASMIKVKKQLSNRQPEKTEGALSKHLLPPQLFHSAWSESQAITQLSPYTNKTTCFTKSNLSSPRFFSILINVK